MQFRGLSFEKREFSHLIEDKGIKAIEGDIIDFIVSLKDRHYTLNSQKTYLSALLHFYNYNDIVPNRKKLLLAYLSNDDIIIIDNNDNNNDNYNNNNKDNNKNEDGDGDIKPYTHEQIQKLLDYSDPRIKVIILIMASAGLRVGALSFLRVGDLTPVPKYNLYQIRVYANSKRNRYYTFCTPECRKAIDNYLDYRRSSGEHITPKSPLIRKEFDKRDIFNSANDVKPVSRSSIKQIIREVLYMSGLRTPIVIPEGKLNYRRSIAMNHSFRKFFDTTCTHDLFNEENNKKISPIPIAHIKPRSYDRYENNSKL
jgi:integrase